ncbi:MAG: tetratricopeptide repeat protein [Crocinitomicaceae bacterium]
MKYFLIFLSFIAAYTFGQEDEFLDELKIGTKKNWSLKDSSIIIRLNKASIDSAFVNYQKAENYARLAEQYSKKIEYLNGEIISLKNLTNCKIYGNDLDSALFFANKCLERSKQLNDYRRILIGYETVGVVYDYKRRYDEAMKFYLKAVEIAEQNDPKLASRSYGNIGLLYKRLNNLKKAEEYQLKCEKIARKYDQKVELMACLNNLGIIGKDQKQYEDALRYYEEGLEIAINIGDRKYESFILSNMSVVFFEQKKTDLGLSYFEKSVKWNKQSGSPLSMAISYHNLACNLQDIKEYQKASVAIDTALQYGLRTDNFDLIMESYNVLGEIKSAQGSHSEAYEAMNMAYNYKDSANIAAINNQVAEMESNFNQKQRNVADSLEKVQLMKERELDQELSDEKIWRRDLLLTLSLIALLVAGAGAFLLFKTNRKVKAKSKIVEDQHREITDSIHYAQRIQDAMISNEEAWNQISPGKFLFYQPKDVVSGDFYWAHHNQDKNLSIWCVADCTGHGVPGAFMSALGSSFLTDIIVDDGETDPAKILGLLRRKVISALTKKGEDDPKDGMDLGLCVWDKKTNMLHFAGANNPLYLIRNKENIGMHEFKRIVDLPEENSILFEVPPNKMPIGSYGGNERQFVSTSIQLEFGDTLILATDGYADQFGGERGKKLKSRPFKEFLLKLQKEPLSEQALTMEQHFEKWKGSNEQLDDVCVVGIRIS